MCRDARFDGVAQCGQLINKRTYNTIMLFFWEKQAVIYFSKFPGLRQEKAIYKGPQGTLVIDLGDISKFRAII